MKDKFEDQLSVHTLWLVRRLIRTNQAKTGLVIYMSKVLDIPQDDALKFYKQYKEKLDEQPTSAQTIGRG